MEESFQKVTRFQCIYCGKEFKTMRHKCRFHPMQKNCLSCAHNCGVNSILVPGDGNYEEATHVKIFECTKEVELVHRILPEMAMKNWQGDCPNWELMKNYQGKESFKRNVVWKQLAGAVNSEYF